MTKTKWHSDQGLVELFHAVGRTLLLNDMEDSHSGNIAVLWTNDQAEEYLVITSTGSQKGDLNPSQICYLSTTETDYGYYKASSESRHPRPHPSPSRCPGFHPCHTKDLTIMTYDDEEKPKHPSPFIPIDPLGILPLRKEQIPVDWVAVPSGSAEMAAVIPDRLAIRPATVIQGPWDICQRPEPKEAFFFAFAWPTILVILTAYTARD